MSSIHENPPVRPGKIYAAIASIMSEVGAIEKTRDNTQGSGYKFRGIDDVYKALQPLLFAHKVFFVPTVLEAGREERASRNGGNLIYTVLKVRYTFFADDGSSFDSLVPGEAMDSGDKSSNKAMSAALKVCLLQLFCVPTEEDKDTENHSPEVLAKGKTAPPPKAAPAPSGKAPPVKGKGATPPAKPAGKRKLSEATQAIVELAAAQSWPMKGVSEFMSAWFGKDTVDSLTGAELITLTDFIESGDHANAMRQAESRGKRR